MITIKASELCQLTRKDLQGKVIAFPTDTIYGVGALYDDQEAIQKIYTMKGRDFQKPLAILIGSLKGLADLEIVPTNPVKDVMNNFWPGALTLILPKGDITLGVRMPNAIVAQTILNHFGPMATTSINVSGTQPLNGFASINQLFGSQIDYFVCDAATFTEVASTVLDVSKPEWRILREGQYKLSDFITKNV